MSKILDKCKAMYYICSVREATNLNKEENKMTNQKLEEKVYRIFDGKIEEITYKELLRDHADETTTPNGVAPRFHIRLNDEAAQAEHDNGNRSAEIAGGYQLWSWGTGGNNPFFTGKDFDTEAEAELALYDTFVYDLEKSDCSWSFYKSQLEEILKEMEETNL